MDCSCQACRGEAAAPHREHAHWSLGSPNDFQQVSDSLGLQWVTRERQWLPKAVPVGKER